MEIVNKNIALPLPFKAAAYLIRQHCRAALILRAVVSGEKVQPGEGKGPLYALP